MGQLAKGGSDPVKVVKGKQTAGMVMVELDSSPNMPLSGLDTAKIAKAFLQKQGVQ